MQLNLAERKCLFKFIWIITLCSCWIILRFLSFMTIMLDSLTKTFNPKQNLFMSKWPTVYHKKARNAQLTIYVGLYSIKMIILWRSRLKTIAFHSEQANKFFVRIFFWTQSKYIQNDRNFPVQWERKNGNKPVRSADTVQPTCAQPPSPFAIYYLLPPRISLRLIARVFVRSNPR